MNKRILPLDEEDLLNILLEQKHLREQVTHLQSKMTAMVNRMRVGSLDENVREFCTTMGISTRDTIGLPSEADIKLRARLIAEEAFEVLEAFFSTLSSGNIFFKRLAYETLELIEKNHPSVNMEALADGFADLDYVVANARVGFGIDGIPIAAEVHRANMTKVGGPVDKFGKCGKPVGWVGPNIRGELRKQGWTCNES